MQLLTRKGFYFFFNLTMKSAFMTETFCRKAFKWNIEIRSEVFLRITLSTHYGEFAQLLAIPDVANARK